MSDLGEFSDFTVGSVLARTWNVMWRKPALFLGLALLTLILNEAIDIYIKISWPTNAYIVGLLPILFRFIMLMVFQLVITPVVFTLLTNDRATIGKSLKLSGERACTVLIGNIIMMFAYILIAVVSLFIVLILRASFVISIIVVIISVTMCQILMLKWFVFAQACMIEKLDEFQSLKRSSELTDGYRYKIFGISLVAYILIFVCAYAGLMVVNINAAASPMFEFKDVLWNSFILILFILIPFAFFNILNTVAYHNLRIVKEGLTPDDLADMSR